METKKILKEQIKELEKLVELKDKRIQELENKTPAWYPSYPWTYSQPYYTLTTDNAQPTTDWPMITCGISGDQA